VRERKREKKEKKSGIRGMASHKKGGRAARKVGAPRAIGLNSTACLTTGQTKASILHIVKVTGQ
jgi:hypothetical protein